MNLRLTYIKYIFVRNPNLRLDMDTKLTLRLRKNVIDRAKEYAQNHNISLSKMIESYLESVTAQKNDDIEITPLVESLSGVIQLDNDYDYKKEYSEYLMKKYK